MPAPQRYEKVAAWNWPYIGPAFVGIDLDLSALETSVAALPGWRRRDRRRAARD